MSYQVTSPNHNEKSIKYKVETKCRLNLSDNDYNLCSFTVGANETLHLTVYPKTSRIISGNEFHKLKTES